jgi:mannose-6-phosphate isomerase-like protein (cupin superfamily)
MAEEFTALDGSRVVELVRPEREGSRNLSLARATISPRRSTYRHRHPEAEEVYYVLQGEGTLEMNRRIERVSAGEARLIPAGAEHRVTCMSEEPMVILCACSPPYRDEETELTQPVPV